VIGCGTQAKKAEKTLFGIQKEGQHTMRFHLTKRLDILAATGAFVIISLFYALYQQLDCTPG